MARKNRKRQTLSPHEPKQLRELIDTWPAVCLVDLDGVPTRVRVSEPLTMCGSDDVWVMPWNGTEFVLSIYLSASTPCREDTTYEWPDRKGDQDTEEMDPLRNERFRLKGSIAPPTPKPMRPVRDMTDPLENPHAGEAQPPWSDDESIPF